MLESKDGDLGRNFIEAQRAAAADADSAPPNNGPSLSNVERTKFPTVRPDAARKPRSERAMAEEAAWLAGCMSEYDGS
jgi:bis(5'-adenosyl)-triphosphatase